MTWTAISALVETVARYVVLAGVAGALVVTATHWAVRAGHLGAFGPLPRGVRRLSDPLLRPLERRLVRWGRNPQDAPLWLLGASIFGGILVLSLIGWLLGWVSQVRLLMGGGPTDWLRFAVAGVTQLLMLALIVRVIASWFGFGAYTRWLRPAYWLTDWLLTPIQRRLPPMGALDLSPLVAYFALFLLRGILLALIP